MDYTNGKIYCIRNSIDGEVYVGSTTQPLSKRFFWHKEGMRAERSKNYKLYQKMREVGEENCYIELIELYPCSSKEELRKREGELIREKGTLNERVAGRTKKEHYVGTIERQRENKQAYYKEHSENLREKQKKYRLENIEKVKEQQRQYYNQNKEKYIQKVKTKREQEQQHNYFVHCPCGSIIKFTNRYDHKKRQKHQNYLKSLSKNEDD